MERYSVILGLKKGIWYYYRDHEVREMQWDEDLYVAKKFEDTFSAIAFLGDMCETKYWGGYFKVEEIFVNR